MDRLSPSLTIVIPALNEEAAIGQTLERTLEAIPEVEQVGGVGHINIVVVSDGSTDCTAAIAQDFVDTHPDTVQLIIFPQNRGYGAAISEGFRVGGGDLVSFLDADGTCDPRFFGPLCAALQEHDADVVLGNRMGPESEMPLVRRLGNRLFALLLGVLSNAPVSDTASGMRVLRRQSLRALEPLPKGLDYTPAMSAKAVIQGLRIVEVPMAYAERIGESKLRAFRDGWRFLRAIFDAVLFFKPARLFLFGFLCCVALFTLLAITPTEFYLTHGRLEEWMIYRFMACFLLGLAGFLLLNAAVLADDLFFLSRRPPRPTFWFQLTRKLWAPSRLALAAGVMVVGSTVLVWPGLWEFATTGHVTLHWSRVIVAAFGFISALQCIITLSLRRSIALWRHYLVATVNESILTEQPSANMPSVRARPEEARV